MAEYVIRRMTTEDRYLKRGDRFILDTSHLYTPQLGECIDTHCALMATSQRHWAHDGYESAPSLEKHGDLERIAR